MLLRCIWSNSYGNNPSIDLSIKFTDITIMHVPVTSYEIINWFDQIVTLLGRMFGHKYGVQHWYKYWLLDLFMCHLYQQIITYMINHINKHVIKLHRSSNQKSTSQENNINIGNYNNNNMNNKPLS